MLERGIEQMLDGKNYKYFWWDRFMNWLDKAEKDKPERKVTLKKNLFARNITSHELFQRSAEKCDTKNPSYLAADVFSDILIDVLKGNADKIILMKDIEQYVDQSLAANPGLQKILKIYTQQANGDLQRFKLLIENWYNDMMDRVGGWYKQQAYKILLLIGLILAVIFNVSTIEIVDKLSGDKATRDAIVQSATHYVNNNIDTKQKSIDKKEDTSSSILIDKANSSKVKSDTSAKKNDTSAIKEKAKQNKLPSPIADKTDTTIKDNSQTSQKNFNDIRLKIDSMKALYKSSIEEPNTTLGLGWGDYGYTNDSLKWVKDSINECRPKYKNAFGKVGYILLESVTTPRKWLGFLITALAISLGAPFWFDLLNKFINLRVSGAKPDEKSSTPVSKTASLNQKPDPTAKG